MKEKLWEIIKTVSHEVKFSWLAMPRRKRDRWGQILGLILIFFLAICFIGCNRWAQFAQNVRTEAEAQLKELNRVTQSEAKAEEKEVEVKLYDITEVRHTVVVPSTEWQEEAGYPCDFYDVALTYTNYKEENKKLVVGNFFVIFDVDGKTYRTNNLPSIDVETFSYAQLPKDESVEATFRFEVPREATNVFVCYVDEIYTTGLPGSTLNKSVDWSQPLR